MPRALIISRNLSSMTGSLAIVLALSERLRADGWEVELCGERAAPNIADRVGAKIHRVRPIPLARGHLGRRLFARACSRVAHRGSYDLVIGHGDAWDQDVLFLHNLIHLAHELIPGGVGKKLTRIGRFHADILRGQRFGVCIANSELMARDLVTRFAIPAARIRVARPGYDPGRFFPAANPDQRRELRQAVGATDEDLVIGLITSGDFHKRGVPLLLGAIARLAPAVRARLRVLVVGKDRIQPHQARARELGIGDRVAFLPARERVEDLYRALDVMVHPAHIEEFGLVVLEAMASGVPVLTSRRVGASELLDDDFMVMSAPDERELTARLEQLLTRPELRRECGARALQAAAGHTWERYLDQVCAILREGGWVSASR
jgi:UDP-glucose:(heptosyl)LPS alpha-1,3-glucosyltransferase